MTNIFLGTNILIDFLSDRKPFSEYAGGIFALGEKRKVKIYVSVISFNNIYYIIRQNSSHKKAISLLSELESLVEVVDAGKTIIKSSLQSDFNDFEDAIQYFSALSKKIDFIVTKNHKDFKSSQLPVFSPQDAYLILNK